MYATDQPFERGAVFSEMFSVLPSTHSTSGRRRDHRQTLLHQVIQRHAFQAVAYLAQFSQHIVRRALLVLLEHQALTRLKSKFWPIPAAASTSSDERPSITEQGLEPLRCARLSLGAQPLSGVAICSGFKRSTVASSASHSLVERLL
jgi:hypothetical protein